MKNRRPRNLSGAPNDHKRSASAIRVIAAIGAVAHVCAAARIDLQLLVQLLYLAEQSSICAATVAER